MDVAQTRNQRVFIVLEDTQGELKHPVGAKPAKGTISIAGLPVADETITIGSQVFTWKALRAGRGQVTIGASAAECVTNLVTAITADIPLVVTAVDGAGDTVVLTAVEPGRVGNSIVLAETSTNITVDGTGSLGATQAGTDGEGVLCTGEVSIEQEAAFEDSEELHYNTRGVIDRFQGQVPPGDWSAPCYMRVAGAGIEPMATAFLEALYGTKAVTPGASVLYSQAYSRGKSLSIFRLQDHFLEFCQGASADKLDLDWDNKSAVKATLSGKFMRKGWCGTSAINLLAGYAQGATTIQVDDAKLYTVGAPFRNVTAADDNNGSGYIVSSVNISANTITFSPGITAEAGWSDNDVIAPFLPSWAKIGTILEGRKAVTDIDGVSATIKTGKVSVSDPAYFFDSIITQSGFCEEFQDDEKRDISTDLSLLFRQADGKHFYDAYNGLDKDIEITLGTEVGKRMRITHPKTFITMPKTSFDKPVVSLQLTGKAYETVQEDSSSILFF